MCGKTLVALFCGWPLVWQNASVAERSFNSNSCVAERSCRKTLLLQNARVAERSYCSNACLTVTFLNGR